VLARFEWSRHIAEKGLDELTQGIQCIDNYSARGYHRIKELNPQLATDIRSFVEPTTQEDSELKPVGGRLDFKQSSPVSHYRSRKSDITVSLFKGYITCNNFMLSRLELLVFGIHH